MNEIVPPTRMNLQIYREKLIGAKNGFELLKQKQDALKKHFRDLCKSIFVLKLGISELADQAFFSLSKAEYAAGHFREKVFQTERIPSAGIQSHTENVAGVHLPKLDLIMGTHCTEDRLLGLSGGGRRVELCRDRFTEYLQTLVQLASLQGSFWAMSEALKVTSRRVNAIENVVIPRFRDTVYYINRELDELEREDFTRLKMQKKKKDAKSKQQTAKKDIAVNEECQSPRRVADMDLDHCSDDDSGDIGDVDINIDDGIHVEGERVGEEEDEEEMMSSTRFNDSENNSKINEVPVTDNATPIDSRSDSREDLRNAVQGAVKRAIKGIELKNQRKTNNNNNNLRKRKGGVSAFV